MRNVNPDQHHWVGLQLIGGPKSPRDAIGATVYLTARGIKQRGDVMSGGSYESSNDQRLHFGLGEMCIRDRWVRLTTQRSIMKEGLRRNCLSPSPLDSFAIATLCGGALQRCADRFYFGVVLLSLIHISCRHASILP